MTNVRILRNPERERERERENIRRAGMDEHVVSPLSIPPTYNQRTRTQARTHATIGIPFACLPPTPIANQPGR